LKLEGALTKALLLACLTTATVAAGAAEVPVGVPASEIPGYVRVRPDLAIAGLPTAAGLGRLKDLGFRSVVDLRAEKEGLEPQKAAIHAAGLRYLNIPVTPTTLTVEDARVLEKLLAEPEAFPILLYCSSGNRAGGLWAVTLRLGGQGEQEALAAGRSAGLKSDAMVEAVKRAFAELEPPLAGAASQP
jgi:uncharacterized protein (TIGR01244 family)